MADVSIIIINYNGSGFIEGCLESVKKNLSGGNGDISYEIIILDNASSDDSSEYIEEFCSENRDFRLINNDNNMGFGAACNLGVQQASGKFILFLNPDCIMLEGGMESVLDFYSGEKKAGALGVKILNSNGSLQMSCRAFPTLARQFYESFFCYRIFRTSRIFGSYFMTWWDHGTVSKVDWLSGSFILIKKKIFEDAGGFDEDYFMYSEDTDLCLRLIRKGYTNYYYPIYCIEHADAGIASNDMSVRESEIWRSRRLYFGKNHSKIHAIILSFLYFLGIMNRIIVFGTASLFSLKARNRKRVSMHLRTLGIYFSKRAVNNTNQKERRKKI